MNLPERFGIFDTETTGVDPQQARIVTAHVGVIDREGAVLEGGRSWLVNPGVDIPDAATEVHGITTAHAATEGAAPATAVQQIVGALLALVREGCPIVIYNAPYDLTLLDREARRHLDIGLPDDLLAAHIIDPLVLDKAADTYRKGSRKLADTAAHYRVNADDAHNAKADAIMAGRVALAVLALPGKWPADTTIEKIHAWSIAWKARQQQGLRDYFARTGKPFDDVRDDWPMIPYPEEAPRA